MLTRKARHRARLRREIARTASTSEPMGLPIEQDTSTIFAAQDFDDDSVLPETLTFHGHTFRFTSVTTCFKYADHRYETVGGYRLILRRHRDGHCVWFAERLDPSDPLWLLPMTAAELNALEPPKPEGGNPPSGGSDVKPPRQLPGTCTVADYNDALVRLNATLL